MRSRAPATELTMAYSDSAKAPTIQICPRLAMVASGAHQPVVVLFGRRVLEFGWTLGEDRVGGEGALAVETPLGDDLDVVAHDVWHLAAAIHHRQRRRRHVRAVHVGDLKVDAESAGVAAQRAWHEHAADAVDLVLRAGAFGMQLAD